MTEIKIVSRWDSSKIILSGKYESIKDCLEKNKGAYLRDAYLRGADLRGADLRGADLWGADLGGAKEYKNSHDFFKEIIRRQKVETFTNPEWAIIGQIIVHSLCWDSIKKRYGKKVIPIFKKLSKAGFSEWFDKYKELK